MLISCWMYIRSLVQINILNKNPFLFSSSDCGIPKNDGTRRTTNDVITVVISAFSRKLLQQTFFSLNFHIINFLKVQSPRNYLQWRHAASSTSSLTSSLSLFHLTVWFWCRTYINVLAKDICCSCCSIIRKHHFLSFHGWFHFTRIRMNEK